jgi:hypothetical protein
MQEEEKLNDVELEKESRLWRCEGDDGCGSEGQNNHAAGSCLSSVCSPNFL